MKMLVKLTIAVWMLLLSGVAGTSVEAPTVVSKPCLQPEKQHIIASQRIAEHLVRFHYRRFKLDQPFSNKIFDSYLRLIDPQRNLLLASDIQQLAPVCQRLGEELLAGRLDLAYRLYNLVQQRRLERYHYALTLLTKPFSFNEEEVFESDRSKAAWPTEVQQLDQLWASRVKFDALNLWLTKKTQPEINLILTKRYQAALKHVAQVNNEDVFYTFINAFTSEIDPHTHYLSPRHAAQFKMEMNLSLEGVGAGLQIVEDQVVVASLVAGGPAANSKVIAINDRIIGVGAPGKKIVEVIGWRLDDVVELIRGPKGTKICLEILPSGNLAKPRKVVLTRERIRLAERAVKASIQQVGRCKLGILTIPSFYIGLAEEVEKQLTQFEQQGVAGVTIDLRSNGGGALNEVVALTGLFIPNGPVVQIRDRQGKITVNLDTDHRWYYTGTVTVLVDHFSASASEIFAAALQDYGRALIVGEQTFGKGTVQQHQALSQNFMQYGQPLGHIQYTIQKFYRINGGSTQLKGVVPDIIMLTGSKPMEIGESFSKNALPWDSIEAVVYQAVGDLTPYLNKLKEQHHRRVLANDEFEFIRQRLAHYHVMKQQGGIVSLNLKQREHELQQQEALLLLQANRRQAKQGKPPLKSLQELPKEDNSPDPYLEETLAITRDLLALQCRADADREAG